MNRWIDEYRESLDEICRRHHVARLELFGSAASERFDPGRSDLDFLVEFEHLESGQFAEAYFGLLESLEELFQRSIDLVMTRAIKNPYFLQSVNESRILLYAA